MEYQIKRVKPVNTSFEQKFNEIIFLSPCPEFLQSNRQSILVPNEAFPKTS